MARNLTSHMNHLKTLYRKSSRKYKNLYVITIAALSIFLLTFLLPNISHRINQSENIRSMKKVIKEITNEVCRFEGAYISDAKELCGIQSHVYDTDETITLNSMGKGYNRLNDEFIEIIKEGSNMPESKQKYDYKAKEHDMKGIKKEFDLILNNIKQKDSVTTIEEYNNLKGEPNLGNISPIRRKTYLKEKHTQSGITSIGKDNILRDRTTSGGFSPIGRNQIKGNKISSNINHSRRSDFCEVVGKSNLRCFCKQPPSYYECYDDENKSSYIELP